MSTMRGLIETFREVIEAGIYPQEPFMCIALNIAVDEGVMSEDRADAAKAAIRGYIGEVISTRAFLEERGHPGTACFTGEWAPKYGVDFYLNWAARPYIGTRSVQDTFRAVIEAGIYPAEDYFMCHALGYAVRQGTITAEEAHLAIEAIDAYITPALTCTMVNAVTRYTAPGESPMPASLWAEEHGVEFYLNWDNRPAIANVDGHDDADS